MTKTKIFLDGVSPDNIKDFDVDGYTTNPSLMKELGVTNYMEYAKKLIKLSNGKPISFEVLSRDKIEEETKILSSLGSNVYVKIPIDGYKNVEVIQNLNKQGFKINATAVFTIEQVNALLCDISYTPIIISMFAGRISDTGEDACVFIESAIRHTKDFPNVEILWASTREVLNIYEAFGLGCSIITVIPSILRKYHSLKNKDLIEYSIETAEQFYKDGENLIIG